MSDFNDTKIPVTKPFLPPREEYEFFLKKVWERNWLTNHGPLVQRLEKELQNYLGTPFLNYLSNGTIALQIAIKALKLTGEIITTPFSYIATTSSIVWENCKPVFADIDPSTLNINPYLIEERINKKTSAILATHVFGNPCDIDLIQKIAAEYDIKVIYDAAHCFGTKYKGKSIYNYGDISTASFHATKLYHTIEGGAIVTKSPELSKKVYRMRNFGHAGPGNFEGLGVNGKNSEFHAAMGLCNLKYIDDVLDRRKKQWHKYEMLIRGLEVKTVRLNSDAKVNYAYFPIIFPSEANLLKTKDQLEQNNIFPRRYFYPSLNKMDYLDRCSKPFSESISKRVLCLPLFHELQDDDIERIINIISGEK